MTAIHLIVSFLAAMGLFTCLWAVLGFCLPCCQKGWILCANTDFVPIFLWLRGMGLVTCPLRILAEGLSEEEQNWLTFKGIELVEREPE